MLQSGYALLQFGLTGAQKDSDRRSMDVTGLIIMYNTCPGHLRPLQNVVYEKIAYKHPRFYSILINMVFHQLAPSKILRIHISDSDRPLNIIESIYIEAALSDLQMV